MKKFTLLDGAALVIWLLPAIYLFSVYSSLPQIVPVHYGLNGAVDQYGNKSELLSTACLLIGLSALVYLLLKFLPAIDPKKKVKYGEATFQKMALGVVIFLAALNIAIIYAAVHRRFEAGKLIFPIIGLMLVFMGNIMNSIKPIYFAGFRTPWALENEDNWRATHRLVSRLWVPAGLVITIVTFILPPGPGTIVFMIGVAVLVIIPFIYSYRYFKKQQINQNP
jgi:uncharacterized membrane protein